MRPERLFCSVVMPPDEMETEAQKIEVALYSYICDATNPRLLEFKDMLRSAGLKLVAQQAYYTGKKLTPEQARREIKFAVESVPRIFGRPTPTTEEVWDRFGPAIEKHGLGQCSKTVLIVSQKV